MTTAASVKAAVLAAVSSGSLPLGLIRVATGLAHWKVEAALDVLVAVGTVVLVGDRYIAAEALAAYHRDMTARTLQGGVAR